MNNRQLDQIIIRNRLAIQYKIEADWGVDLQYIVEQFVHTENNCGNCGYVIFVNGQAWPPL